MTAAKSNGRWKLAMSFLRIHRVRRACGHFWFSRYGLRGEVREVLFREGMLRTTPCDECAKKPEWGGRRHA